MLLMQAPLATLNMLSKQHTRTRTRDLAELEHAQKHLVTTNEQRQQDW